VYLYGAKNQGHDVLVLTDGCFLSVILFYHPISCAQNRLWKLLGIVRA